MEDPAARPGPAGAPDEHAGPDLWPGPTTGGADPAGPAPEDLDPAWKAEARKAFRMWGLGFLAAGSAFVLPADLRVYAILSFAVAAALFLFGVIRGIRVLMRGRAIPLAWRAGLALGPVLSGLTFSAMGAALTFLSTAVFSRGRQIRDGRHLLLPPVVRDGAWAEDAPAPAVRDPAVAAAWRENGRTEHASVAAFARLTLDLMALGAPPELLADAQSDARDELRHTLLCFGLARGLDGRAESPGPFPAARTGGLPANRTLAFVRLAVDSLVDGALNEGVSARVVGRLAKTCEDPAIRPVLAEIAADEGRHAAHGWEVVAWCLREEPVAVAHALRGALATLPTRLADPLPAGARDGAWERWGIPGDALVAEEYAKARAHVVRRVRGMLEGARAAA